MVFSTSASVIGRFMTAVYRSLRKIFMPECVVHIAGMTIEAFTIYFSHLGYIGISLLTAFGSTYIPFSGGLVVMTAGALTKSGQFNFFLVLATVTAASTFADYLVYRI